MTKKIKLTHTVGGQDFTRTTARAYTHVLVVRPNIEAMLDRVPEVDEAKVIEEADYAFQYAQGLLATPVGQKYYYRRGQGGFYLNKRGKHMEVKQYHHDNAHEFVQPTQQQERDVKISQAYQMRTDKLKAISVRAGEGWSVASWHGSESLAAKATGKYSNWGYHTRVEQINGGHPATLRAMVEIEVTLTPAEIDQIRKEYAVAWAEEIEAGEVTAEPSAADAWQGMLQLGEPGSEVGEIEIRWDLVTDEDYAEEEL